MLRNLNAALQGHEHRLLGALLGLLYLAQTEANGAGERAALTALHLGVFLLWQPIWQRDRRLDRASLGALLLFAMIFVAGASAAVLALWQLGLVGILAARSFASVRERNVHLISLGIVFVLLFMHTLPTLFGYPVPGSVRLVFDTLAMGLVATLLVLPSAGTSAGPPRQYPIDFYRGAALTLVTALAACSTALLTEMSSRPYTSALMLVLVAFVAMLLLLSWLLSPQTGFGGIANLWQKSLLNIGSPFEEWMAALSELAETSQHPDEFLASATRALMDLPGVAGVRVHRGDVTELPTLGPGLQRGEVTRHRVALQRAGVALEVFCHRAPGPALSKHLQLLLTLLADFLAAKERAYRQAAESQLRAVYETGARMAHDIKNLLQSLSTLTHLAETSAGEGERADRAAALLRRQLPEMRRRLGEALRKLEADAQEHAETVDSLAWIRSAQSALAIDDVPLVVEGSGCAIPLTLLRSAFENWLDNVRQKRLTDISIQAHCCCSGEGDMAMIRFSDTGAAIAPEIARDLCKVPVNSAQGFGVGLYQVTRLAEGFGYQFFLETNAAGRVAFVLRGGAGRAGGGSGSGKPAGADHALDEDGG